MLTYRLAAIGLIGLVVGCAREAVPEARVTPSTGPQALATTPPVTLTPRAAKAVRDLAARESRPEKLYLRVRVVWGGCSGCLHKLDLEPDVAPETDKIFRDQGVRVVIWKRQEEMLRGTVVDYLDEPERRGFSIKNPTWNEPGARKHLLPLVREAAQENPNEPSNHHGIGIYLMEAGQYAEAVPALEHALKLDPKFLAAYQPLGECLLKLDRKERAVAVLQKGWKLANEEDADDTRNSIGRLLTEQGALPQATPPQRQQ